MLKLRKILSSSNFMILFGIFLLIIGLGGIWLQNVRENSTIILESAGGAGPNGNDPNAFRPPLQAEIIVPLATEVISNPDGSQVEVTPPPQPIGKIPERLEIPSIQLDAPIFPEHYKQIFLGDQVYIQWRVPFRRAAGWHDTTALLGDAGNTVLNGHNNAYGEVFKDLVNLQEGDMINVYSGESVFEYKVNLVLLLPEKYQSIEVRIKNASWIMPTTDERLTLVTCWPQESNTHRLIVVAFPVNNDPQATQ
ncbi:MAG: hypothetical protein A2X25_05175 [Chloroflexi bacterium GWB2_49_20]|nr:MAG: hypothetical protein A2X25_05175 [Chloroflexi bacterium GWB2_49_20]OGN78563.1 MAG: hypothetical protein A2X26_12255 [Chloroflexi bacterium GWC2_49_37]OGN83264.1 MAG: hypothetical protein A2X27_13695 [Chloroflexi bacterium GWD2_49_16]HBG75138.1 hypothetical protein [Anaerolineae bacterium]HCC78942.1 hypothetical protein [Anaerolineae bacterium]